MLLKMERELAFIYSSEATLASDPVGADWVEVVTADKESPNSIFLSHSGAQKDFAEQLCEDLERAKQSPFFEKRPDSLPKGAQFAPLIFTAIQECKLAVVVVSEEYFTRSKWPMLELASIVQEGGCKILPLFLGLSCKEYKNLKRREQWFQAWDEWSKEDSRICLDAWQAALRSLDGVNGMQYVKANGEVTYRREIVATVCDVMQRRSQLLEIIVVDANECDLNQPGVGTATSKLNLCVPSGCLKKARLPAVVSLTMLLLLCGYDHYFHDSKVDKQSHSALIEYLHRELQTPVKSHQESMIPTCDSEHWRERIELSYKNKKYKKKYKPMDDQFDPHSTFWGILHSVCSIENFEILLLGMVVFIKLHL